MRLANRVALVTGGSRGIGRAICEALADEGATVAVNYNASGDKAHAVVDEIVSHGGTATAFHADVAHLVELEAMIDRVEREVGPIDILVNNAATTRFIDFDAIDEREFDRVFALNVRGLFFCMQYVARRMAERRYGRIVNISSTSGVVGPASMAHYCASKGAVNALTKAAAKELAPVNITVNAVCPGGTATDMLVPTLLERGVHIDDEPSGPMRLVGRPSDIAGAVVYLSSDEAAWTTGALIVVDGGRTGA